MIVDYIIAQTISKKKNFLNSKQVALHHLKYFLSQATKT